METTSNRIGVLQLRSLSPYLQRELSKRYALFEFWKSPPQLRREFLVEHSNSIKAVVCDGVKGAGAEIIDALPLLEIVASHSSGLDKIDLDRCRKRGIRVTYTPDAVTDEVADMAILLILATARRICAADQFVRSGEWKNADFKLTTKAELGRQLLRERKHLIAPSITTRDPRKPTQTTPTITASSNWHQTETAHIVNRQVIDALGPKGVLINVARGPHVDEAELVSALMEGRLGGAGLDVFEKEPEVPEQLLGLENVVILPHIGSGTVETRKAMVDLVLRNLEAHFSGRPLLTPAV